MAPAADVALPDHVSTRAASPGPVAGTVGWITRPAPAPRGLPDRGVRASNARTTGLGDRLGDGPGPGHRRDGPSRSVDPVRHAAALRQARRERAATDAARRADLRALRHAAAAHGAHRARRPRRVRAGLAQRPGHPGHRRPVRARRVHRARAPGHAVAGSRPPCTRGVPTRAARAGRRRPAGRCRRGCPSTQPPPPRRPDRHPGEPEPDQPAGGAPPAVVLRTVPHLPSTAPVPWRRASGLPRGCAADRVHVAQPAPPPQLPRGAVPGAGHRRAGTATRIRNFYDEYGAVMDVPAEFYLETLDHVFMAHDLPRGTFTWRGQRVDLSVIRDTALLTVEGARYGMCSPG